MEAGDERIADTIIEIYHKQEFLITVAQRFKLLSLFLKVAGSIPGVANIHICDSFFFWRRLRRAKRQTQPARGTHRRQPPGRVPVWSREWCVICWRHCHAPSSTTDAPMFLVRTCRSKALSVRSRKLAIPELPATAIAVDETKSCVPSWIRKHGCEARSGWSHMWRLAG